MKNTIIFSLLCVLYACTSNKEADQSTGAGSQIDSTTKNTQDNSDAMLLAKLKRIQQMAIFIWSKYHTNDKQRYVNVESALRAVSFHRAKEGKDDSAKGRFIVKHLEETVTNLQLLVCTPYQIKMTFFPDLDYLALSRIVMVFHRGDKSLYGEFAKQLPEGTQSLLILANKDKVLKSSEQCLALYLIHEINHLYQYLHLKDMPENQREPDAWNIQLECLKISLQKSDSLIFEQMSQRQSKIPYEQEAFFQRNKDWLTRMFGQTNGFLELLSINAYGYSTALEPANREILGR